MPDPGSVSKIRVFLSHSSSDKEVVGTLYRRLKDDGFAPWIDDEDLIAGQNWSLAIEDAVKNSDAVLVCLSTTSVKKRGYVHKEMLMALDLADYQPEGTIFVIPLRLDECKVPERLSGLHYVDLFRDNGYEKLTKALYLKAGAMDKDRLAGSAAADVSVSAPAVVIEQIDPVKPVDGIKGPEDASTSEAENDNKDKDDGKKDGWITKYQAIIIAVITGLVALTGAYWQFVRKPPSDPPTIRYSGRVLDSVTRKTIGGASVIVETDGVPLQYSTDSSGVFYLELKTSKDTARIRVSADGYDPSDRNVPLSRTGVEEFPLSPAVKGPANTAAPSPSPPIPTSSSPAVKNGGPESPNTPGRPRETPSRSRTTPARTPDPLEKELEKGP